MWLNLNQISNIPMKIDKQKLVELLVEKTRMEEEEVRSQLDQLIERIIGAAKRGKALEIREFGLFYFDEAGELKFDPSDELSTEISFKYAGMKPVELKPERDTSFPEAEEEDDLEDFDFLSDINSDDSNVYPGTEEEKGVFADQEKPAEKKKSIPLKSSKFQAKKRSGSIMWVFAAILVVAALVLAYLYFIGSLATTTQQPSPAVTQVEPGELNTLNEDERQSSATENSEGQPAETDNQRQESALPEAEIEVESSVEPPEEIIPSDPVEPARETEVSTVNQPLYGLRGSVMEEANNGYSIVLHSFTEEENARSTSESLTQQGYRAIVNSRTVADRTMWRVSVGQFETLQDAQQATSNLPEPFNTRNFIQRIQIN
jgi:cell division septation protein DedD